MPSRSLLSDHLWYWVSLRTSVYNLDCLPRDTSQCRSSSSLQLIDRRKVWLDHTPHWPSTKAHRDSQDRRNQHHDKHCRSPSRFVDDLLHFQWEKDQSQSREYLRSFFLVRRMNSGEWCLFTYLVPSFVRWNQWYSTLILSVLLSQWRVNFHHRLFQRLPTLVVSEGETWMRVFALHDNRTSSGSVQCPSRSATSESMMKTVTIAHPYSFFSVHKMICFARETFEQPKPSTDELNGLCSSIYFILKMKKVI